MGRAEGVPEEERRRKGLESLSAGAAHSSSLFDRAEKTEHLLHSLVQEDFDRALV